MFVNRKLMLAAGLCVALTGTANAETYRSTNWLPDADAISVGLIWLSQEITAKSNGDMTVEYFGNGSLVPAKPTLQAVGDGVAQFGFAYSGYTPAETPVTEAISSYFTFSGAPINVLAGAFGEFVMTDPQLYQEWRRHGVVPFAGWETPKYDLLCNTPPMTSLGDLAGKKVRFPGGALSDFGKEALGLVPVNIPSSESYQAQQTGQTDCSSLRPSQLIDVPLMDVTKSVTRLQTGLVFASPSVIINDDMWHEISAEQRRLILDLGARMMAKQQVYYYARDAESLTAAQEAGVALVDPDEEVKARIAEWVKSRQQVALETARSTAGVEDPEALFARFQVLVDKWSGIMAGVKDRLDEEELTAIFKENIFDHIDAATYGMD